jgi:hypothetical protein
MACGGNIKGTHGLDMKKQRPDEDFRTFADRSSYEFQRCVLNKGYRYTGECPDTEWNRAVPRCAGRELVPLPVKGS